LELTYETLKIQKATMNEIAARKALGEDLARLFRGQIADMRQAMFLGELPDTPQIVDANGRFALNYPLGESAFLEVEPIGLGQMDANSWRDVHRVKLVRVHDNGVVLL
jgi:hypothetical protein